MVSALSIALFVGIPAAVIVGLGLVFTTFRDTILTSSRNLGSVFTGIFTEPISGAIEQVSGAFSDLPPIRIDVPNLQFGGGGVSLFGQDIGNFLEQLLGQDNGEMPSVNGNGDTPTPTPTPTPPMEEPGPLFGGRFAEFFNVSTSQGVQRLSFEEVQGLQPGNVIGFFDVLGTSETEFLPFNVQQVQASLEAGQRLRLSGQIFEDIKGIRNVQDLF